MSNPTPPVGPPVGPPEDVTAQVGITDELAAQGFTQEQINKVNHALLTATKRAEGDPLGMVVVNGETIYVRVALPDSLGPVHSWRIIDPSDGSRNEFLSAPTVSGTIVHNPETEVTP